MHPTDDANQLAALEDRQPREPLISQQRARLADVGVLGDGTRLARHHFARRLAVSREQVEIAHHADDGAALAANGQAVNRRSARIRVTCSTEGSSVTVTTYRLMMSRTRIGGADGVVDTASSTAPGPVI